jgi:hypothetical protein
MIAKVGFVYNSLERGDQKELLRHMVSRVVIDHEGTISLELRSPFSYLQDITNWILGNSGAEDNQGCSKKKTGEDHFTSFPRTVCSLTALYCGENRIRTCDHALRHDNRLAGGPIRPLWHLPSHDFQAEGVGFEPTVTETATEVFKTTALSRSAIPPDGVSTHAF